MYRENFPVRIREARERVGRGTAVDLVESDGAVYPAALVYQRE